MFTRKVFWQKMFDLSFDHIEKYIESYLILIPVVIFAMRLDILYTDDVIFLKHDICSFCLKHKRPCKSVSLAQNGSTIFFSRGAGPQDWPVQKNKQPTPAKTTRNRRLLFYSSIPCILRSINYILGAFAYFRCCLYDRISPQFFFTHTKEHSSYFLLLFFACSGTVRPWVVKRSMYLLNCRVQSPPPREQYRLAERPTKKRLADFLWLLIF